MSNWDRFDGSSRTKNVVGVLQKLIFRVEESRLETGEGVVEYFQQRYIDLFHEGGPVGLQDVKERIEQILLDKGCKEVVM
jgi:hypothetical protein